ncbi:MAG: methyltransferase [Alphaproteobacteria bacterium]|nr:methyltransferase [Alphaproteobacteria bacterium]
MNDPALFIASNTAPIAPPLVPEITLRLATEVVPLWRKTEEELEAIGVPPPYWAFAWAGGQALARFVLDHPEDIRDRSVLDFGAGSGLVGLAAARAGARDVLCADVDHFARAAIQLNATLNGVHLRTTGEDVIGQTTPFELILVGDMCYERPLADRLLAWLHQQIGNGAEVLLGDPGRSYFPKQGFEKLAAYQVQTTRELEDREIRDTGVYRLLAGPGPT